MKTTQPTTEAVTRGDHIKTADGTIYYVLDPVITREYTTDYYAHDKYRTTHIIRRSEVTSVCGAIGTNKERIKQLLKRTELLEQQALEYEFFVTEATSEGAKLNILDELFDLYEQIAQNKKLIAILF